MQNTININIAVDVVKALSDRSLNNNIYMMDDSIFKSDSQGTNFLRTLCEPGQIINWVVYAIDLQTPIAIKDIVFEHLTDDNEKEKKNEKLRHRRLHSNDNSDFKTWTGIVPCIMLGRKYFYQLVLKMGNGKDSILSIDTASICHY